MFSLHVMRIRAQGYQGQLPDDFQQKNQNTTKLNQKLVIFALKLHVFKKIGQKNSDKSNMLDHTTTCKAAQNTSFWCRDFNNPKKFHVAPDMGVRRNFQEGAKPPTTIKQICAFSARRTQNMPFFGAPKAQTKVCVFSDVLDWKVGHCVTKIEKFEYSICFDCQSLG